MPLPAPNLDDRRFQDLVDDAKRLVQRRCPEWTDHNVSDPGITLIETFAYVVDQVLYRLNRVPERSYVTFLELMGVELFPPSAARVPVTFWLTAPLDEDRVVEAGDRGRDPAAPDERGDRVPHDRGPRRSSAAGARYVMTGGADAQPFDQSSELANERPVAAFSADAAARRHAVHRARPGGAELRRRASTSTASPRATASIPPTRRGCGRRSAPTAGCGATSRTAPAGSTSPATSSSTSRRRTPRRCSRSAPAAGCGAGSSSRSGDDADAVHGHARCSSPSTRRRSAARSTAVHGEDVVDELVGVSEGVPGQRFALLRKPVVASERPVQLEVAGPDGWEPWQQVQSFGESGDDDRHWRLNANDGAIVFGPAVRLADGSLAVRRRPARRRPHPCPPLPHRWRPRRQRRRPRDRHAQVGDPVHRPRRQPPPGRRRRRRRDARGGQDPRSARARHAQPGGDGPGLRAARPGGDARGRPGPLPAGRRRWPADRRRRRRRRACGC